MRPAPGTRVFAAADLVGGVLRLYGRGVFVGEEVPPPGIALFGIDLHAIGRANPKIVLDDGTVVWGCECWWGAEGALAKYDRIEAADLHAARVEAYGFDPMMTPAGDISS